MIYVYIIMIGVAVILTGAWVTFTLHKQPKLSIAAGLALCLFASLSVHAAWKMRTGGDRVYWHGSVRAIRTLIERGDVNDVVAAIDVVLPPDVTYNDNLKLEIYEELRRVDPGLVK